MTRAKNPFSVGERVAIYEGPNRYVGVVERSPSVFGSPDTIDVRCIVGRDGLDLMHPFHPKQLRRLIPRKRREWTLEFCSGTAAIARTGPALAPGETVHVVEKKAKGKRK